MMVYFASRRMEILGQASTGLPEGYPLVEDCKVEEVETGVASFECRVVFDRSTRLALESMCQAGNYLLRSNGDENEFYTIIDVEIDTKEQEIYVYAEDAGLDLLNEIVGAYEAAEAHNAEWYVNQYIQDSGFEIGINEVPNLVRKLSWDGEQTVTERLSSIATQFGGFEISYSFDIHGMEITHKYINIYARRGRDMGEQLRLNRDIDRIITKKSVANLATALYVTGGIPEGADTPITLSGYQYDDGDIYTDGNYLKSREAVAKWSRYAWEKSIPGYQGHLVRQYSYDTTSQQTLCAHAVTELKKRCDMEVNYEVDILKLSEHIKIGDRINIVDDAGELYLSARILKLETSICHQKQTATLGEYLIRSSGISQRVEDLTRQLETVAIASASGKFYTTYTWIAYADDENGTGISLNPEGKRYLGTAVNQTAEEVDISQPELFTWAKVQGEAGKDGTDGADATVLRIDSSRGTVFKNNAVSTVLSVVVYHGSQRITDREGLTGAFGSGAYLEWSWQRINESTFGVISAEDSRLTNDGFSLCLSPADVDTKCTFQCSLIV